MRTLEIRSIIITTLLAVAATGNTAPATSEQKVSVDKSKKEAKQPPIEEKDAKQPPIEKEAKQPPIEPEAIAALEKMGTYLREQKSFVVRVATETDYVDDEGQKLRMSAKGELFVRRPDHLRADVASDRKQRQFFYDGKSFIINSPRAGFYASLPAPPTILELADLLQDKYGLELPMVDLFRWGGDKPDFAEITSATLVGSTEINGATTDHYAFRQPGVDWQIWIERGDRPVPRKLVLTTTDDPARPEHAIDMTWSLGVKQEDAVFAFTPPKDAVKIAVAELPMQTDETRRAKRSARN